MRSYACTGPAAKPCRVVEDGGSRGILAVDWPSIGNGMQWNGMGRVEWND